MFGVTNSDSLQASLKYRYNYVLLLQQMLLQDLLWLCVTCGQWLPWATQCNQRKGCWTNPGCPPRVLVASHHLTLTTFWESSKAEPAHSWVQLPCSWKTLPVRRTITAKNGFRSAFSLLSLSQDIQWFVLGWEHTFSAQGGQAVSLIRVPSCHTCHSCLSGPSMFCILIPALLFIELILQILLSIKIQLLPPWQSDICVHLSQRQLNPALISSSPTPSSFSLLFPSLQLSVGSHNTEAQFRRTKRKRSNTHHSFLL